MGIRELNLHCDSILKHVIAYIHVHNIIQVEKKFEKIMVSRNVSAKSNETR